MPTKLIGSLPNQAPRNADLGTVAFMDADQVNIGGGAITLGASATQGYFQNTDISDVKPSLLLDFANGKTLDPRITFTRSTTATFYDGKTAKAEENLLQYSQSFSNTSVWSYGGNLSSGATVAPDGTNTAFAQIPTTANTNVSLYQRYATTSGQPQAHSIYAKAGGFYIIQLRESENGGIYATFNLNAGTVVNQNGCTATITSVGNGWYRCAMTFSFSSSYSRMSAYIVPNSYTSGEIPTVTGDGYSCVYYWGAQAEQRSGASAYTPTTSSPVTNYIPALQTAPAGAPRFDHDPITGESKGLLIEEQRTNLLTYSETFSSWANYGALSIVSGATIAPNGALSATQIIGNASQTTSFLDQSISSGMTAPCTCSVFVKAGTTSKVGLSSRTGSYTYQVTYDLRGSGSVVSYTGSAITSTGIASVGNGWYRIWASLTNCEQMNIHLLPPGHTSTTYDFAAGYLTANHWLYIWGAQVEAGAFPTSYIPTTSAQVTRGADGAVMTGTNFYSWYRQDEGTLYAETKALSDTVGHVDNGISISTTGASGSSMALLMDTRAGQNASFYVFNVGVNTGSVSNVTTMLGAYRKMVGSYAVNSVAMATDGVLSNIATNTAIPPGTQLGIGVYPFSVGIFDNGYVKKIVYYPKRLSNAELQEMTL